MGKQQRATQEHTLTQANLPEPLHVTKATFLLPEG